MFQRILNLQTLLIKKSHFLFGPRAVGKSTLVSLSIDQFTLFDLLNEETYRNLLRQPAILGESIREPNQIVVIDEIQRIPELLNEVQRLIFQKKGCFLLTGSSARKLKHGASNLLGGRAWEANLFPLISAEIPHFDLLQILNRGGLPDVYQSRYFKKELGSYVSLYLQQEIKAEALTRNVQSFAEFLELVAIANGDEINYESFASDCQVSTSTIKNYFQILEDTLIGNLLPSFTETTKRKAISTAKFYLFDPGVTNFLMGRKSVSRRTPEFGTLFEQMLHGEIKAYLDYHRMHDCLFYWRSTSQYEVDFLIRDKSENWIAIEAKGTTNPSPKEYRGIAALEEELPLKKKIVVCLAEKPRLLERNIEILPLRLFLETLWGGGLL
jgi:predicted AAA+ superfamily ATPase